MKKILPILIMLFILVIFLQSIFNIFMKKHDIDYSLKNDLLTFNIHETLKEGTKYSFVIEDSNKNYYNFSYNHDFNNQDRVITKIKTYGDKNFGCIVPIYKRGYFSNFYCTYKGNTYAYSYLKEGLVPGFDIVFEKIKKDGYFKDNYTESDKTVSKYNNTYYIGNLMDNYKVLMWNYTGLDIFDNKGLNRYKILNEGDLYENDYSTIVGKYYVILTKEDTSQIQYFDLVKKKTDIIETSVSLNGEYEVLGAYKKQLYIVNVGDYTEYTINPYNKQIKQIGSTDTGFKGIEDNKIVDIPAGEFKNNVDSYRAVRRIYDSDIEEKYGKIEVYQSGNYYYFKTDDNTFYRSSRRKPAGGTGLFKLDKVSDWKVVDNNILVISDNTLYLYTEDYGLRKMIVNNEFKYRYKNMYDLWKAK